MNNSYISPESKFCTYTKDYKRSRIFSDAQKILKMYAEMLRNEKILSLRIQFRYIYAYLNTNIYLNINEKFLGFRVLGFNHTEYIPWCQTENVKITMINYH